MSPTGPIYPDPGCCDRAQREIEFWEKAAVVALTCLYAIDPVKTARLCDEELDRSGGLLGRIRETAGPTKEKL